MCSWSMHANVKELSHRSDNLFKAESLYHYSFLTCNDQRRDSGKSEWSGLGECSLHNKVSTGQYEGEQCGQIETERASAVEWIHNM